MVYGTERHIVQCSEKDTVGSVIERFVGAAAGEGRRRVVAARKMTGEVVNDTVCGWVGLKVVGWAKARICF